MSRAGRSRLRHRWSQASTSSLNRSRCTRGAKSSSACSPRTTGSGVTTTRAATCEHAYVITSELPDPDDLGHIQAAWAIAKCVCEQEGAEAVIDIHAVRAHPAAEIAELPPTRGFELMHEISLLFDTVSDGSVAAWTTGMRKFGRPDVLLLGLPSETSAEAAVRLRDLAAILAAGERIEAADIVSTDDGDFEARPVPAEHASLIDGEALWLAEIDRVEGPESSDSSESSEG